MSVAGWDLVPTFPLLCPLRPSDDTQDENQARESHGGCQLGFLLPLGFQSCGDLAGCGAGKTHCLGALRIQYRIFLADCSDLVKNLKDSVDEPLVLAPQMAGL